jgi:hypothetical protein
MIIGSNKAKNMIIQQGITPRLIQLLDDPIGGDDLKLEGKYHIQYKNVTTLD